MKKVIFILLVFFSYINFINAKTLKVEELPYYVSITNKVTNKEDIIKVKKVFAEETGEVLFNIDYLNYEVNDNFLVYNDYNKDIWSKDENLKNIFNTIVYYGYNNKEKNDLNYFITQVIVWKYISNYPVLISDEFGNWNKSYNYEHNILTSLVEKHYNIDPIFNNSYEKEIWTNEKFTYHYNSLILDNPNNDYFEFKNDKKDLYIYATKVGKYNLEFKKDYEEESYCYTDGTNIYWQSLAGPEDLTYHLSYQVDGTKLNIKDNLHGVNKRVGDALLSSKYELYIDDELMLTTDNLEDVFVKSNTTYTIKDISNSPGINNSEDIIFTIDNEEYTLNIDKYIVSKNISLKINSNKDYYVYLKSNNELYEIINKETDLITLPYGTYYITDKLDFSKELIINNNIDDVLFIEDLEKEDKNGEEDLIIEDKDNVIEEIKNDVRNEGGENEQEESAVKEENVKNPQTIDNIYHFLTSFILSLFFIWLMISELLINREM